MINENWETQMDEHHGRASRQNLTKAQVHRHNACGFNDERCSQSRERVKKENTSASSRQRQWDREVKVGTHELHSFGGCDPTRTVSFECEPTVCDTPNVHISKPSPPLAIQPPHSIATPPQHTDLTVVDASDDIHGVSTTGDLDAHSAVIEDDAEAESDIQEVNNTVEQSEEKALPTPDQVQELALAEVRIFGIARHSTSDSLSQLFGLEPSCVTVVRDESFGFAHSAIALVRCVHRVREAATAQGYSVVVQ